MNERDVPGRGGSSDDVGRGLVRPGPDGPGHEQQVSEIQRARLLAAMTQVVSERGAANVTVARVVARSGVSRRTFYELFEDREDCFLAAFDDAIARIASEVVPAYEHPGPWRAKIRAALIALLQILDDEPGTGRLVIVETLGAGPKALERRRRVLAQVITAVDEGRREARTGDGPPPLTAEGVVGGVFSVIHARMLAGDRRALLKLAGPLMSTIVLPYLGAAAARRELDRPVPKAPARPRPVNSRSDPLRELPMRLTYRTVRVLMAVAALGGRGSYPSNRQVADAAGIKDQGQISKLLARLKGLGLIEQTRRGPARGGPNAWALTKKGREVEDAITQQTGRA